MTINNRPLNNTRKFLYYANYEKHARQKKASPVKKPLESIKQKINKLKKIYEMMRQKDAHKKKVLSDATRKRMNLNLKREIRFIY